MHREDQAGAEVASEVRPKAALLCLVLAAGVGFWPIADLSAAARRTLCVLVLVSGLWLSEALPVWVTALLIPIAATLLGITDAKHAFVGFGDPILFLFFGTFLLTAAAFEHGLSARLARSVLSSAFVRGSSVRLLWAIAALGFLISAWVNNTATTVLLLPLALSAQSRTVRSERGAIVPILLMTSYAPSISGIATPVGTAPNLIGLRLLENTTGTHVSFAHWCGLFAPLALITTLITAGYLAWAWRRQPGVTEPPPPIDLEGPPEPWSRAEKTLLWVCGLVIAFWIGPGLLDSLTLGKLAWLRAFSARLPEALVPLLGGLLLFVLPRDRAGGRILTTRVLAHIEWPTLLLFGGGLTLGALMFETGLARFLGETLFHALPVKSAAGVIFASTLMAAGLSEITSNTASASLVVPIVLSLAQAAHVDPVPPALAATVACSFGFMLPVSTPPNALVYATGRVSMRHMIRYGILLDLLGVALITVWVSLFAI